MKRRQLLIGALGGAVAASSWNFGRAFAGVASATTGGSPPFTMNFAPHFGMFVELGGRSLEDQLRFAADQGFRAWEDNEMKDRPVAEQETIARTMAALNMEMGVISALRGVWNKVNFAGNDQGSRAEVLQTLRKAVESANRVNARLLTVVLGMAHASLPKGHQTANAIELLRECCDVVEKDNLTMVLEPLNQRTNHPGVFLSTSPHAFEICRAVNRPSCKILFDIYHQQVTEGNLVPNIARCWNEIAYFQTADNPGRWEPGTGEINYRFVLQHIYDKGYRGIVGMEHGNRGRGAAGEQAVIDAYRAIDPQSTENS